MASTTGQAGRVGDDRAAVPGDLQPVQPVEVELGQPAEARAQEVHRPGRDDRHLAHPPTELGQRLEHAGDRFDGVRIVLDRREVPSKSKKKPHRSALGQPSV